MSDTNGKPIHLTNGERKLVIEACTAAIESWIEKEKKGADSEAVNFYRARQRQYRRIIKECVVADPVAKSQ